MVPSTVPFCSSVVVHVAALQDCDHTPISPPRSPRSSLGQDTATEPGCPNHRASKGRRTRERMSVEGERDERETWATKA